MAPGQSGVGILPDDQHLDRVEWNCEGSEDIMACGQVLTSCLQFGAEEIAHVMDLRLHVLQRGGPSGLHELRQWFDWMLTHGLYCSERVEAVHIRCMTDGRRALGTPWPVDLTNDTEG